MAQIRIWKHGCRSGSDGTPLARRRDLGLSRDVAEVFELPPPKRFVHFCSLEAGRHGEDATEQREDVCFDQGRLPLVIFVECAENVRRDDLLPYSFQAGGGEMLA